MIVFSYCIMNNAIWTVKYMPKSLNEIQGQNKALAVIQRFLEDFPKDKALLIYGPPGTGKTATVYAIAKQYNYELLELNASDFRTEKDVNEKIKNAVMQNSLFGKKKIILVDEIDGISGTYDRGGLNAILKLLEITKFPIFLTANDIWDKKFSELRKKVVLVEYSKLRYTSIKAVLKKICVYEKLECEDDALTQLSIKAGGDLRSAILDLQSLGKKVTVEKVNELYDRDREEKIINSLLRIFKTTSEETAMNAFDNVDEDFEKIIFWIEENIPFEYKKPYDLYKAFEVLSKTDILKSYIRRRNHWRFLSYIYYYLTVGIALSKEEKYSGFSRLRPPKRILNMWIANNKRAAMKSLAEKLYKKLHTGKNTLLKENIYYIKFILKNDKELLKKVVEELELEKKEVDWIKK